MTHDDDHDRGLAHDLAVMTGRVLQRRRALALLLGGGTALALVGCGGDGGSSTSTASSADTTATTTTTTPATTGTTTTTGNASCIADPSETAGPQPADGTNTSSGATSNVLTANGIVRSDIRSSFLTSTTTASGVTTTLTLTLVSATACTPLAGYAIYLWNADNEGHYSLYSAPTESYLRGVQVTDANGQVTFVTNFPACYDGRYPHIHFEVYRSLAAATSGAAAALTSQFAMTAAICATVFADTGLYPASATKFAQVGIATDGVFGDNSAAQIAQQTPAFTGSVSAGFVATATIGLAG